MARPKYAKALRVISAYTQPKYSARRKRILYEDIIGRFVMIKGERKYLYRWTDSNYDRMFAKTIYRL
jgi:hypothetical protein